MENNNVKDSSIVEEKTKRQRAPSAEKCSQDVQLSKKLSYFLRHGATKEKIQIHSDGFVCVNDLLAHPKFRGITVEDIERVVKTNNKQRYGLSTIENSLHIRAFQGHSLSTLDDESMLERIEHAHEIPLCVHGTFENKLSLIKEQGLSTMNRNHIHFTTSDHNTNQAIHKKSNILLYLDVEKAMAAGIQFFRSPNNVILTKGIQGFIPWDFIHHTKTRTTHTHCNKQTSPPLTPSLSSSPTPESVPREEQEGNF